MNLKNLVMPVKPTAQMLRQFACAWLGFLLGIGLLQWLAKGHVLTGQILCALALVFGILGLIQPKAIKWLFLGAMLIAVPIGWAVSQLVLLIMFYLVFTPLALFFRWRGRDLLARRPDPNRPTFWLPKTTPTDLRAYFRQY